VILSAEQLKQILAAGGAVVLDAASLTYVQLSELASAAGSGVGRIRLKNCGWLTGGQLSQLARLAPGKVEFDLVSDGSTPPAP
jgi:hypothetical protein